MGKLTIQEIARVLIEKNGLDKREANRFVAEMFADRMGACKVYQGKDYTCRNPWEYYKKGRDHYLLHDKTRRQLEFMLKMLAARGEEETFSYIRRFILHNDEMPLTRLYKRYKEKFHV